LELPRLACDSHQLSARSEERTLELASIITVLGFGGDGILPDAKYMNSEEIRLMATNAIQLEHDS